MKYLLLSVLILAGCATTAEDMKEADLFCYNNGGVASIDAKYNSTVKVTCVNGAVFKFKPDPLQTT